jgi:hypothetical protein
MASTLPAMLTGHVAGGQIVLDAPLALPEGSSIHVVVTAAQPANSGEVSKSDAPLREQLKAFLSHQVDHLPPDAAENHDKYLRDLILDDHSQ